MTPDPYLGIENAVLRENLQHQPRGGYYPANRVSVEQAVLNYTRDAAHAAFFDDITGSLAPGKPPILGCYLKISFAIAPTAIHQTRAELTLAGGRIVHQS